MSAEEKAVWGKHLKTASQDAKTYIDESIAGLATIYASKSDILRATVTVSSADPQDGSTIWLRPLLTE